MEKIIEIVERNYPWSTDLVERLQKHSPWTYLHGLRVAEIAYKLGSELKLTDDELLLLAVSGILHDIGKIYVDNNILNGDRLLTDEEREIIRDHARKGFVMVDAHNAKIAKIISAHHEFQNNPYPRNNQRSEEEESLYLEKIIAMCDAVDSAMSDRPYKKAKTDLEAFLSLSSNYDKDLLKSAIDIRNKLSRN